MRTRPNKLWAFGPPLSLALLFFAYYVKMPWFRDYIDPRFPWVKEHLARFVVQPDVVMVKDPHKETSDRYRTDGTVPAATPTPAPAAAVPGLPPPPLTMERFAADPSLWPKTVKLRTTIEFPAVFNGKIVGKVQAPAGTETNLKLVKDTQLGLEYQGGGAWVPASATDLLDKVKITSR